MIALGCDGAGYDLMQTVKAHLDKRNTPYMCFGAESNGPSDFPLFAQHVAAAVLDGRCDKGIVICGTGIGISIAANRFGSIRCALCHDVFSAKATREHNNSNMLAMGGRVIGPGLACEIVDAWLDTQFSHAERHQRRIDMIEVTNA
ncbi:MAG: ribose 5-phosphate isomerase B [Defluviitaleaceae bacterium]|nr:ribose 5-phosphate isomerase B [Defluviitaleaceae bacterium]